MKIRSGATSASKLNILIADDDDGDRKHVLRALKYSGLPCDCVETTTIEEAIEACDAKQFDCAVVDYRLPGHDGLWGISALNERAPYMAIIMSTGQGDETVAAEAMKRGASDYIPKALITPESMFRSVTNAMDKTDLRRKVEQQKEELENFARVLVHDFKSPIQSVRGFLTVIEQNIRAGNFQKTSEYCQIVIKGVDRMGALIDALHRYAMAETPVEFEVLDMCQVMSDTLSNLEHLIQERGARVTSDTQAAVRGYGPLLTQLMQNLIGNGIKYCEAEIPHVHVGAKPLNGHQWLFSVKDNGIGISPEHVEAVFEPFKRLHGVGKYEGTGLGLATCKKIVERHGGEIWCESKEGEGATFFFTLPGVVEESRKSVGTN